MINLNNKVIIFNSPIYIEKKDVKEDYLPPIGQGYIVTYLKENNVDVELIDCIYEHFGLKEILDIIEEKKPTHVGMNIFTANEHIVRSVIEKCNYKVDFIIGGQAVKFMYNEIINYITKNKNLNDQAMRFINFNINVITGTTADTTYTAQNTGNVITKKKMFDQSI